ncbi:uncharacterized protein FMAN_09807 [Fusarium mangiferae]|uniref:Uncharacterized protein n=1 Tax=Fusarium mangiferae TaxID=192010 RepID=A0A1L7TNZ8_FUSMA|nr:uncharacterized protein FMAN_09807 [Fusarium mangiferae]CVL00314.1 uncharacterized protein FMAN_09807 [Fusarium mangiferae]
MEGEKEGKISGTIFMVKVEDEPFPRDPDEKDPFPTTCEEDNKFCLARESSLQEQLTSHREEVTAFHEDKESGLAREAFLNEQLTTHREELATCHKHSAGCAADSTLAKELIASSCPGQHGKYGIIGGKQYKFWCHRYHNLRDPKETHNSINTMLDCIKLCN